MPSGSSKLSAPVECRRDIETRIGARRDRLRASSCGRAQRTGEFRDDLEAKQIGVFVSLVLNGLALQRASGEELPPVELVLDLLRDAVGGRSQPRSSGDVSA